MVTLERLRLENFLNVAEADVPLRDQGLVLIVGENGSGKSAIFTEGPLYGLYGESFRYGPKPGRDVIRTGAKRFFVRAGCPYRRRRRYTDRASP
jgi:DNA repair exonuclease SbcCD ATPase subunit